METMEEPKAATARSHPLTPTQAEGLEWFCPLFMGTCDSLQLGECRSRDSETVSKPRLPRGVSR